MNNNTNQGLPNISNMSNMTDTNNTNLNSMGSIPSMNLNTNSLDNELNSMSNLENMNIVMSNINQMSMDNKNMYNMNTTGNMIGLTDKDIASDLLKDSKFGITGLTMALAESTNPQVRKLLKEQLNNCISNHHRLSDIAINKNWYPAFEVPMQQIQNDIQDAQNIIR